MDKNPPANAGDTGLIPGLGRLHMPWSNQVCVPQLLSLCSGARELQLLKPMGLDPVLCCTRSHCGEQPAHHTLFPHSFSELGSQSDFSYHTRGLAGTS